MNAEPVDAPRFRRVLSHFCTGIVVITALDGSCPVGLTCQSFTSLSLEPPLVAFTVARTSTSWPRIRTGGRFAVNILGEGQRAVSQAFATRGVDKFAAVEWALGRHGSPWLIGAVAHIDCDIDAVHPGGDHDIVVGRVRWLAESDLPTAPLLYFRSTYRGLRTEESAA